MKHTIKHHYEDICNVYLKAFCEKHDYPFTHPETGWVADRVGEIAVIGDYYVDFSTIRTDIDEAVPEGEFIKYYDYCSEAHEFGLTVPNYHSWVRGCPRTPPDIFERLRELKTETENLIREYSNGRDF